MRLLFSILLLASLISCGNSKKTTTTANNLNGTWVPVAEEFAGQPLPPAAFSKQRLTITDSTYTMVAESVDKGIVRAGTSTLDIYGQEGVNKGKHITAIYKLEKEELVVCYNLKGDAYPASFDTKDQPLFFMCRFKKQND